MSGQTGIAFIGTGFVADYYMTTLANHPQLRLAGVWDIDAARLQQFRSYWNVRAYASEAELLADPAIAIIVNLTPPESHHAVNRAALLARYDAELAALADRRDVGIRLEDFHVGIRLDVARALRPAS